MEYIRYMMYNLVQRNQELEFHNDVLQRMIHKYTLINDELVNENKALREDFNQKDTKPPLLPLPTNQ